MRVQIAEADWNPYAGLPVGIQIGFAIALMVTLLAFVDLVVLRVNAGRAERRIDGLHDGPQESQFLWVFLVPALNEEVTIADSVSRLREVEATHALAIVIDDGSDDATPQVLSAMDDPLVRVLRRDLPMARQGKAEALNAAWRHLHDHVLTSPDHAHWSASEVIVGIVDADGRLDPAAPERVVRHLADPAVGGVQIQVRIYNRQRVLARAQDVEFAIFGLVYQLGRAFWGTANMGGNGQFNRLAALDDIAGPAGPWRSRLTEDQDVGLRLIAAGWRNSHEPHASVAQQGLPQLRPLLRQRTRWAQGNWQALQLMSTVGRAEITFLARVDLLLYLLMPILQMVSAAALVTAVVLAVVQDVPFYTAAWPILLFFLGTTLGPGLVALMVRGHGVRGFLTALLLVLPYTCYSWLTFLAVLRALGRQVVGRGSWAKTKREPLVRG
ncbi:MAG TPA: glycosyltransferase family 2 protein [Ornithinibacter sp.]|nr:glycosyltransferase family 2 protein [Ornithinibacter sp.]